MKILKPLLLSTIISGVMCSTVFAGELQNGSLFTQDFDGANSAAAARFDIAADPSGSIVGDFLEVHGFTSTDCSPVGEIVFEGTVANYTFTSGETVIALPGKMWFMLRSANGDADPTAIQSIQIDPINGISGDVFTSLVPGDKCFAVTCAGGSCLYGGGTGAAHDIALNL